MTSAGSAALTSGILGNIGVSTNDTSWQSRMLRSAVPIGVSTGQQILSQDLKPGAALLQGVASVLATSLASLGAEAIGDLRYPTAVQASPIGTLEHTTLHALNGALQGALSNLKDPGFGALGGALGAVTAENLAGLLPDSFTPEQRSNIARFGAASLAFLAGQDVNAAIQTATTAVEFNFNAHKATELSRTVPEQEFVDEMMKAEQAERGTFLPEQRELWEYKFRKLYYTLKQTDLSRSILNPGQQRFEEQASLSREEHCNQLLAQVDPEKLKTAEGRKEAIRIADNMDSHYKGMGFNLALAPLLGVLGGGASLRLMPRTGRIGTVAETSMVPSRNVQGLDLASAQRTCQELRPADSSFYSNVFQVRLKRGSDFPGNPDRAHFQEANKQLYSAMLKDPQLKQMLERDFPGIQDSVKPSVNGHSPSRPPIDQGLTWHHNAYEPGLMELVLRRAHRAPGPVQSNLHPNQKGGMELWGGGRQTNKTVERKSK